MHIKDGNQMSQVFTNITIINHADKIRAEYGIISAEQVRSVTLDNVLVSTRTTTLCLPTDIIYKLGLRVLQQVNAMTARGIQTTRLFQDATISLCGREGIFDCLELPEGENAVLGLVPLGALGLELDLKNQHLKVLPISPTETYLSI